MRQTIRQYSRQLRSYISTHKRFVISCLGVFVFGVYIVIFSLSTRGGVEIRRYSSDLQPVDEPIVLSLSRELGSVTPSIEPSIPGEFRLDHGLFGIKKITFIARESMKADTEYHITFGEAKRVMFGSVNVPRVSLKTQKAPTLSAFSLRDKKLVSMDEVFDARLSSRASGLRDLVLTSQPELALVRTTSDDSHFIWRSQDMLSPDTEYTFVLRDMKQEEELARTTVRSAGQPEMEQPIKPANVAPGDELKIVFKQSIDARNRPDIRFSGEGVGAWRGEREYVFTPAGLEPATTYRYVLPKGLRTTDGGILREDSQHTFQTNGAVSVIGATPRGYELAQGSQQIKLTFDQAVDRKSAEERFRISSGSVQNFSWQGATLIASVKDLGFQQVVAVSVEPGVQPVFGRVMTTPFRYTFTTEARTVKLNVPYYRQAYAQSCEAASLRMALAYRGTQDNDWNILQKFGYNPRSRDTVNNQWDDPTVQFVGDVNGDQGRGTGWGVYAGPVAAAAAQYGRSSAIAYGANASFVADQIYTGNPVIVWGVWRQGAKIDSWSTPAGKQISGPIPMHVRLIVGVKGEPANPLGFYVNDPISGQLYWTTQQFVANTAAAGLAAQLLAIY